MNVVLKKRISRYLTVITIIALITACSSTIPPEDIPPPLFSELTADSAFYLGKDKQLGNDENLIWQFLATQALIKERKFVMADAVITSLQTKILSTEQSAILNLLIADKFYAQKKLPETQNALDNIDVQHLKQTENLHYLKLQSTVFIRNELPLEASNTLLLLAPLLTINAEKQQYNDLLLAQLILLSSEQLNQYQPTSKETEITTDIADEELKITEIETEISNVAIDLSEKEVTTEQTFKEGWYALAALYQKSKLRPNLLGRRLNQWKSLYPDHAVLQFMPLVLTNIAALSPYQPENIAVVLPLSGRYEKQGKAVQIGLLSAYYQQQSYLSATEKNSVPKLHFFDSTTVPSAQLAVQLKKANIDFVIGPLMKQEIEALLPLLENTPVLALNRFIEKVPSFSEKTETLTDKHIPWHYAFPLSPEDEAQQAAMMIHSDQHQNPLIIVPDSSYGKRVAKAFKTQWAKLTPNSDVQIEAHYFNSKAKFSTFIGDLLHTDKSKSRIRQMQAITKLPLKTEVRSRRDVDAIYIVSKRDELILLKPFIDVSVSPFAQKIPLYASSRSHSLDRNNMQNKELSGLVFSDNSFLLTPESELNKEIEKSWKKQSFSSLRLFSLGFDSYQLIAQLIYLQNNGDAVYKGLIGDLSLSSDNNVEAKLSWAKYQNGTLIEIASPISAE